MASGLIEKHVAETLRLGFRYHSPALSDDETIIGVTISTPTGISTGTPDITATTIEVPVSGGTAGTDYTIRFIASTSQGQSFVDDYIVKVIT